MCSTRCNVHSTSFKESVSLCEPHQFASIQEQVAPWESRATRTFQAC